MSREGEPKPAENFIGDMIFGVTLEYIQDHLREIQEELAQINVELTKEDTPEQLRKSSENRKAKIERVLELSPDEIFRSLQEVYNFIRELEEGGLTKTDILRKIKNERPALFQDTRKFYDIIRSQTWGYRLGQELFTFRFRE